MAGRVQVRRVQYHTKGSVEYPTYGNADSGLDVGANPWLKRLVPASLDVSMSHASSEVMHREDVELSASADASVDSSRVRVLDRTSYEERLVFRYAPAGKKKCERAQD